jgi:hypothetical protein
VAGPRQLEYQLMLRAVREGFSGAHTLALFREFGLRMRTQDFYALWGNAQTVVRETGEEATRPLDTVPTLAETPPYPANPSAAPGVLQTVRLTYREKVTGKYRTVYHSVKSDNGVTRQEAINTAITAYSPHSEEYETTLVAAAHTSAIRIVPQEAAA